MYAFLCFSELSTLQDQFLRHPLLLPLYFKNIMQGKKALIWKDREAEYLFVLFSSNLSVLSEESQTRRSQLAGEKNNLQKAADLCKCGPFKYIYLRVCTDHLVKIKIVKESNECQHLKTIKDYTSHIKLAMTEEYLLMKVWEHCLVSV